VAELSARATRVGGDPAKLNIAALKHCFNPRPRVGGRRSLLRVCQCNDEFQSTPPRGGRRLPSSRSIAR